MIGDFSFISNECDVEEFRLAHRALFASPYRFTLARMCSLRSYERDSEVELSQGQILGTIQLPIDSLYTWCDAVHERWPGARFHCVVYPVTALTPNSYVEIITYEPNQPITYKPIKALEFKEGEI